MNEIKQGDTPNTGGINIGDQGGERKFGAGWVPIDFSSLKKYLANTLSAENYTHIGSIKAISGKEYSIVLRKDEDSKIVANKNEHYTIEVDGFSHKTDRATRDRNGFMKEGTGIVLSPTCVCVIDNRLYKRDSNNLWHSYSIEENANDTSIITFIKEDSVKYIPNDIQKEYVNNSIATVLSYTTPPKQKDYISQNSTLRSSTSIILKQSPMQGEGDIPISDPENYKRETLKTDAGILCVDKIDGTQERYSVRYAVWNDLIFEKLQ